MNSLEKIRRGTRSKNRGGAPKANRNALKAGLHSGEQRARNAMVRRIVRHARQAIAQASVASTREIREMREI